MTQKSSKDLTVRFGDYLDIVEGCEMKYNGAFHGYASNFTRFDNGPVESDVDGPQLRSHGFSPKGIGEYSFRYEVNPLSGMGDAVRVTTYNVRVTDRGD